MIVKTHLVPLKKEDSNKGSCGKLIDYLSKESKMFFSHSKKRIKKAEAKKIIDDHSKGQLGKNDSKWYSPMYSLSNDECKHIVNFLFNKDYEHFYQLDKNEIEIYNNYLIYLARRFQDEMALNFEKEELGINSGADLVYVGVVENERVYKYHDKEVKCGIRKRGEVKDGFNSHIHLIQSRKANNEKKSKISPDTINKGRSKENFGTNVKSGFNKEIFFTTIEKTFDYHTKMKRDVLNTYENRKFKKKSKENKINNMARKFYPQELQDKLKSETNILDYFLDLSDRGILIYEGKKGNSEYIFNNGSQKTGSIGLNETKQSWKDFSSGKGGGLFDAVREFDKIYNFIEVWNFIEEKSGYVDHNFNTVNPKKIKAEKSTPKSEIKILKVGEVKNKFILDYYVNERQISEDLVKKYLKEISYENNGKEFVIGGVENQKGSFNVRGGGRNGGFKSVIGGHNDICVLRGNNDVKIFEGMIDYLSWLELENKSEAKETVVILNSTSNYKSAIEVINDLGSSRITCYVDMDEGGDKFIVNLKDIYGTKVTDARADYDLSEQIDMNERLKLDNLRKTSKLGYGF